MTKVSKLKAHLNSVQELELMTDMLEQSAARTIARMRDSILEGRPYFQQIWRIHGVLKTLSPPLPEIVHKHLVVVVGIEWGMPGNLLNRVIAEAKQLQQEHGADLLVAGRMAHAHFKTDEGHTTHFFSAPKNPVLAEIQPIYKVVAQYARVTIVFPQFESLSKQEVQQASFSVGDVGKEEVDAPEEAVAPSTIESEIAAGRFIVEPDLQEVVNYLNEAVVGLTVSHYFSESVLAYSAAQMVAMRNGHENAKKEVEKYRRRYYRARREQIDLKLRELYGSRIAHQKGRA